jgi:hypothetical protein
MSLYQPVMALTMLRKWIGSRSAKRRCPPSLCLNFGSPSQNTSSTISVHQIVDLVCLVVFGHMELDFRRLVMLRMLLSIPRHLYASQQL